MYEHWVIDQQPVKKTPAAVDPELKEELEKQDDEEHYYDPDFDKDWDADDSQPLHDDSIGETDDGGQNTPDDEDGIYIHDETEWEEVE